MKPIMKYALKINEVTILEEVPNYWTNTDYINLLEKFNFPDAKDISPKNLREMLFMAVSDYEPNEAATIVLTYKLSDRLSEGQISQISNDMLLDKVSEEYPEIDMQYDLFSVNQLLYKGYNGKFPNAKAIAIRFDIQSVEDSVLEITKQVVLKSFNAGLADSNIVKRLFQDEMTTDKNFDDAEGILWELHKNDKHNYTLITSEYWINKEDIISSDFQGICLFADAIS
jgi:hypothetical protein